MRWSWLALAIVLPGCTTVPESPRMDLATPAQDLMPAASCASPILRQECSQQTSETNPCHRCIAQRCCKTRQACESSPGCNDLARCATGCAGDGTGACMNRCYEMHPGDAQTYMEHFTCVSVRCVEDQCSDKNLCTECMNQKCCDAYARCRTDLACERLSHCTRDCQVGDAGCVEACLKLFPLGGVLFSAFVSCVRVACRQECP